MKPAGTQPQMVDEARSAEALQKAEIRQEADILQGPLARQEALIAALRASPRATVTLAALAEARGWIDGIHARKLSTSPKPMPASVAAALALQPGERVAFREVELVCGRRVLSRADNWFVASRLPAWINDRLDGSDDPFGLLIGDLEPRREVLSLALLGRAGEAQVPAELFQLTAVVSGITSRQPTSPQGARHERLPLAVVIETYLADAVT